MSELLPGPELEPLLAAASAKHSHLCPRQVLGVRIALAGAAYLGLPLPRADKRLLVIIETDGCFADGVEAAAGVCIGHRTLRVEDYGKIAATFVDADSGAAVRIAPHTEVRIKAWRYAPSEHRRYFAQLHAYQVMPENELLSIQEVRLKRSAAELLSVPGVRAICSYCGEEIINRRELIAGGRTLCRTCAGDGYYRAAVDYQPAYPTILQDSTRITLPNCIA